MRRRIDEAVQHMCQAEGGEDADEMAVLGRLFTSIQSTVTNYTIKKDEKEIALNYNTIDDLLANAGVFNGATVGRFSAMNLT